MRTVGVVTVARSDFGLYGPILEAIRDDDRLQAVLFVGGMHLEPRFGETVAEVEASGFEIAARIPMDLTDDRPGGIARSMARGTAEFAGAFERSTPDLLLTLGDRFEMHTAAVAALPFRLPVAHIHGGESTEGLIDEAIRHSLTKLSHLHFAATEEYARRIVQMGEEPWRVTVSGAPGLDAIAQLVPLTMEELAERHGIRLEHPTILVTFHPVTLEYDRTEEQVGALLTALEAVDMDIVFTAPNADTTRTLVTEAIERFVAVHERAQLVANLGSRAYLTLLRHVVAMVGNSSSGIIEAASFELPVVNVGNRQSGRTRARNVLDVGGDVAEIADGIRRAVAPEFRRSLKGLVNPYGDGRAAERIVERLRSVDIDSRLIVKRFYDVRSICASSSSELSNSAPTASGPS